MAVVPKLSTLPDSANPLKIQASDWNALLNHREYVNVLDYGADPLGVSSSTTAFTAALATGKSVGVPAGTYLVTGLTMSTAGQVIEGVGQGTSLLMRESNGTIITLANRSQQLRHLGVRGESATPVFTGHNIVIDGGATDVQDIVLLDVDSRWCLGGLSNLALHAPTSPGGLLIDGGSYSHQGAAGQPVAVVGNTGLAAGINYVTITNMVTHKANQPWNFIACAGMVIQGCQIGGFNWGVSTTAGICTVNRAIGNRIIGNVNVLGSGHNLIGNALAPTYTLTFDTHATDEANGCVWLGTEANTASIVTVGANNLILRHVHGGSHALGLGPSASLAAIDFDSASGDIFVPGAIRLPNNKNYKQLAADGVTELRFGGYNSSNNLFVGQSTVGDFTSLVGTVNLYFQIGATTRLNLQDTTLVPQQTNQLNLGEAAQRWKKYFGREMSLSALSTFADNAAALAGGLVAGDIYRTATGVVMVVF